MLDMVEALVGPEPRVLDLACGTGSITARLFARFPKAVSTGVDLDPALLAIAEGTFAGDDRVTFVTADLKDPDWPARLPYDSYDAVLTATALHWLHSEPLAVLYGQVAELVRDGGVFMNADHMIDESTPRGSTRRSARSGTPRMDRPRPAGVLRLVRVVAARRPGPGPRRSRRPAASRSTGSTPTATCPSATWHARVLREKGFAEARRCGARPRTPWCWPSSSARRHRDRAVRTEKGGTEDPYRPLGVAYRVRAPWTGTTASARAAGSSGPRAGGRTRPPRPRP